MLQGTYLLMRVYLTKFNELTIIHKETPPIAVKHAQEKILHKTQFLTIR